MLWPNAPLSVSLLRPYKVVASANDVPKSAKPTSERSEPASPADRDTNPRVSVKTFCGFSGVVDLLRMETGIARVMTRVAVASAQHPFPVFAHGCCGFRVLKLHTAEDSGHADLEHTA